MSETEIIIGLCGLAEEQLRLIRELALRLEELGCVDAAESADREEEKLRKLLGDAPRKKGELSVRMTNSSLIDYTCLSPNSSERGHGIDRITIHHMAADLTIEACGNGFAQASRRASANYGIGSDGRVGLYVSEFRRAWTSSSRANDDRAITIEVANSGGSPNWTVSSEAYAKLLDLCEDICRRHGKTKMVWIEDFSKRINYEPAENEMKMTIHQDFAATLCPGPYLLRRMPLIAAEVTRRLNVKEEEEMKRYNTLEELPEWGQPTVERLLELGLLKGRDTGLDLSDDMLRVLVVNDRAGLYDRLDAEEDKNVE